MLFDVDTFNVPEFDRILSRGLSNGLGTRDGQMCIEAAICTVLGFPHSDDPKCVAESVRAFKIKLNDLQWSSPTARAAGMRDLGLAQLGSLGVVKNKQFTRRIGEQTIKVLIPHLFRSVFADNKEMLEHADKCESAGDAANAAADAANAAADAAYAARYAALTAGWAGSAARDVADAARYAAYAAGVADAARYAANAASAAEYAAHIADAARYATGAARYATGVDRDFPGVDTYLIMAAQIALEVLKELNSPGCKLLAL